MAHAAAAVANLRRAQNAHVAGGSWVGETHFGGFLGKGPGKIYLYEVDKELIKIFTYLKVRRFHLVLFIVLWF